MMSPLWWLPLLAAGLAAVALWRGIARLGREGQHLQQSLARLREVRPRLAQVKSEIDQTTRGLQDRGRR